MLGRRRNRKGRSGARVEKEGERRKLEVVPLASLGSSLCSFPPWTRSGRDSPFLGSFSEDCKRAIEGTRENKRRRVSGNGILSLAAAKRPFVPSFRATARSSNLCLPFPTELDVSLDGAGVVILVDGEGGE